MKWINGASSLTLALLAGCVAAPVPASNPTAVEPEVITKTRIVDTSCQWVKPIYPAPSDVLADSTAVQISDHNKAGVSHCGWKPPKK